MKYLTSKQVEALSPVKREVYEKRIARERERIRVDLVGFPNSIPVCFGPLGMIYWMNQSKLRALSNALANEVQKCDMTIAELVKLYDEIDEKIGEES